MQPKFTATLAAFIVAVYLSPVQSYALEAITVCKGSVGKSYFSAPPQGWIEDKISKHTIIFWRDGKDGYDITSDDEYRTFSFKDEGAVIIQVHGGDSGDKTFVVRHPVRTVEVYQLSLDKKGYGTLIWANLKNRPPPAGIIKGSIFTAKCAPPPGP